MLENLTLIRWATLHHAYGTAEDFPRWLRQLRSTDKRVRRRAYNNLVEYSNHQGSIYEVTPYVVPFIIELAISEDVLNRNMLLIMLMHLADISSRIYELTVIPVDTPASISPTLKDYKMKQAVYVILWKAHPLFLKLLDDRKGNIRWRTAQLLCCFWPQFDVIAPHIISYLRREQREDVLDKVMIDFEWFLKKAGKTIV